MGSDTKPTVGKLSEPHGRASWATASRATAWCANGRVSKRPLGRLLAELGAEYEVTDQPAAVLSATKIILPGVGHFGQMMQAIDKLGLRQPLKEKIASGIPFLGICVGLQCLFDSSEEAPGAPAAAPAV